jgi:hypothetical protein
LKLKIKLIFGTLKMAISMSRMLRFVSK